MVRQAIIYLIISIIIVLFASQIQKILTLINVIYDVVNAKLAPIFSSSSPGIIFRQTFTLLLLPVFVTGIPAIAYRLIQGKTMPYFLESTWIVWLTLVLATVLIK